MSKLTEKENRLIEVFLSEFKKMIEAEVNVSFNPRSLTIISQPDLKKEDKFDFVSYNKWLDGIEIQAYVGSNSNFIQTFLEIPINILVSAERAGKHYLSKQDQKKLIKAFKLLKEIKLEKQK